MYWTGTEGENHLIVMELLGPSLESVLKKYKKHFSIPTLLTLAEQMVCYLDFHNIDNAYRSFS